MIIESILDDAKVLCRAATLHNFTTFCRLALPQITAQVEELELAVVDDRARSLPADIQIAPHGIFWGQTWRTSFPHLATFSGKLFHLSPEEANRGLVAMKLAVIAWDEIYLAKREAAIKGG